MNKKNELRKWLWKWHIIAGLICMPFLLLLSVTGILYLFKDNYNRMAYYQVQNIEPSTQVNELTSLSEQLRSALKYTENGISSFVLPKKFDVVHQPTIAATEFHEKSKGAIENKIYVNPIDAVVTGSISQTDTFMYQVLKLHSELLLNKPGTLLIELVSSWFIVLILTGMYVWWPRKNLTAGGFFKIRRNAGDKAFRRDMHAVISFWLSLLLLIIIFGGMSWTNIFGGQLNWLQSKTNTGYPKTWHLTNSLQSSFSASENIQPMNMDVLAKRVEKLHLKGQVIITLPESNKAPIKISNQAFWLSDQKVIYLDQYSGEVIKFHTWKDVGVLMDLRQVFMRLHQGQYGLINWLILLFTVQIFIISTFSAFISYIRRKPEKSWGLPAIPSTFKVNVTLLALICVLALLLPMFGMSLIFLFSVRLFKKSKIVGKY